MSTIAAVIGRIFIAALFVVSGANKLLAPEPVQQLLQSTNLPANLAMPIGIFEIVAGLLLALGLLTRLVALVLAIFTLGTIFFVHNQFGDYEQGTQALKNLAITGGLLMVFAFGQVRGSLDYYRDRNRTREAELRAARAEGRAEGAEAAHRHD
ncbi:DoxX family protein [Erythrobacter sp. LQ02-29]|uniref:DoxX family protein n=1 Tax=unclassified Erythrobacter TaxID=2633097 RepID=UPI001BFC16C4|nr:MULTISPECIES: DoxX family protein [unclassified Erythrobacter]MCP9221577.1 DoxX family protein [Erythrobacter sp. LQ02-29]QWC57163.1 DoxX family membrane protein [Erythrobacter sp. 3-20A1M]